MELLENFLIAPVRSLAWQRKRWVQIGALVMIEQKSKEELAALVMDRVRKTATCQNLTGVTISPCGHDGDWEIKHRSFSGTLSDECRNELTTIVIELKKRYRLK
jgi:hypothetical protein